MADNKVSCRCRNCSASTHKRLLLVAALLSLDGTRLGLCSSALTVPVSLLLLAGNHCSNRRALRVLFLECVAAALAQATHPTERDLWLLFSPVTTKNVVFLSVLKNFERFLKVYVVNALHLILLRGKVNQVNCMLIRWLMLIKFLLFFLFLLAIFVMQCRVHDFERNVKTRFFRQEINRVNILKFWL